MIGILSRRSRGAGAAGPVAAAGSVAVAGPGPAPVAVALGGPGAVAGAAPTPAPTAAAVGTTRAVPGARQRVFQALRGGATVNAAAVEAGVPLALAEVMVDEMRRIGLLQDATSLCASGLGACGGGDSEEVKVHCAGCPILPLSPKGTLPHLHA